MSIVPSDASKSNHLVQSVMDYLRANDSEGWCHVIAAKKSYGLDIDAVVADAASNGSNAELSALATVTATQATDYYKAKREAAESARDSEKDRAKREAADAALHRDAETKEKQEPQRNTNETQRRLPALPALPAKFAKPEEASEDKTEEASEDKTTVTATRTKDYYRAKREAADAATSSYWTEILKKPLGDYASWLCGEIYAARIGGKDWQALFPFIRHLKSHPDMRNSTPTAAFKTVDSLLKGWTAACRKKNEAPQYGFNGDPWQDWFNVDRADAKVEFVDTWKKVRYLLGQGAMEQARDRARKVRLRVSENEDTRESRGCEPSRNRVEDDYEFFVSLAGHLQVVTGNRPIMLPCKLLGETLKVSKMTITRWRRWALEDKFLKETKTHSFGRHQATEFRFNVERYKSLGEQAQPGTAQSFINLSDERQ